MDSQMLREHLARIVETAQEAIYTKDLRGIITSWNKAAERVYGYTEQEIVGRPVRLLAAPDREDEVPELMRRVAGGEVIDRLETERVTKSGGRIWVSISLSPMRDNAGAVIGISAIALDITARKRSEMAAREESEKFRSLVEQNVAAVAIIRRNGTIGYINSYFAELYGYTQGELMGRPLLELIPASEQERVSVELREQLLSEGGHIQLPTAIIAKDGRRVELLISARQGLYEGEKASIAVAVDITQRLEAEKQLAASERRFRLVVDEAPDAIVLYDVDKDRLIEANKAAERLFGCSRDEILKHNPAHFYPSEQPDRQPVGQSYADHNRQALAGKQVSYERLIRNMAGEERLCEVTLLRLPSSTQRVLRASFVDITEQRRASRALADQATLLATEHELSPDGILAVDENAKIISVNRRFREIFNVSAEDVAAKEDEPVLAGVVAQVADSDGFLRRVRELYERPDDVAHEEIALKDGRTIERDTMPMKGPNGEYLGRVWFFRDITDHKQAQQRLADQLTILSTEYDVSPDAILVVDDQHKIVSYNQRFLQTFHVPDELIATRDGGRMLPFVAEQQAEIEVFLARTKHFYDNINEGGRDELVLKDGRIFDRRTAPMQRANGDYMGRVWFHRDITSDIKRKQELERLNRALQTLSHANSAVVHAASEDELVSQMCRVVVDIGGYRMAWIGLARHDVAKSIEVAASAGIIGDYFNKADLTWADDSGGGSEVGRVIRGGEPLITRSFDAEQNTTSLRDEAAKLGFSATAAFPLHKGGDVFGVLSICAGSRDAFDDDELKLLDELAGDLAYGIGALRDRTAAVDSEQRQRTSLVATIGAIANTVEMRDEYTAGHQHRVAVLAVAIARELHLSQDQLEGIYLAGIVHDVGKINVPAEILSKPGKLTKLQFQLIQSHVEIGYEILKGIDFPWPIADIVYQHHERLDGTGYPRGLKSNDILLEAKIIGVADTVEAMMSHRPYRPGLGIDAALAEIENGRDRIYDADVVTACISLFRAKGFTFDQMKNTRSGDISERFIDMDQAQIGPAMLLPVA